MCVTKAPYGKDLDEKINMEKAITTQITDKGLCPS